MLCNTITSINQRPLDSFSSGPLNSGEQFKTIIALLFIHLFIKIDITYYIYAVYSCITKSTCIEPLQTRLVLIIVLFNPWPARINNIYKQLEYVDETPTDVSPEFKLFATQLIFYIQC
jgi:hypothetical protein